jgi:hypothetical protein
MCLSVLTGASIAGVAQPFGAVGGEERGQSWAHAKWYVEGHVKKLAFCRKTQPAWLGFALRVVGKLKRMLMPSATSRPASLLGAG